MTKELKTCITCGKPQLLDAFSSNGKTKKGTPVSRAACKACERDRIAVYRKRQQDNSYPLLCNKCQIRVAKVLPYSIRFRVAALCEACDPQKP